MVAGLLIIALILGSVWAIPAVLAETEAGEPGRPINVVSAPAEPGELPGVLDAAASSSEGPGTADEVIQETVTAELAGAPGSSSVTVLDAESGQVRAERASGEARIPASN